MSLTKRQKTNLWITALWCGIAGVLGTLIFVLVGVLSTPTAAAVVKTPSIPSVNASRFEQIHTGDNEGTVDHFCVGHDGLFFGQYTGEFSVIRDDPLCP
jgi:hypothetical protein